jgi:hypothetical protein
LTSAATTAHSGGANPVIETGAFVDGTQTSKDKYTAANDHVGFCDRLNICPAITRARSASISVSAFCHICFGLALC